MSCFLIAFFLGNHLHQAFQLFNLASLFSPSWLPLPLIKIEDEWTPSSFPVRFALLPEVALEFGEVAVVEDVIVGLAVQHRRDHVAPGLLRRRLARR